MSPQPAPSADAPSSAPAAAPSMAGEHEAILVELMQMGLELARGIHRQAVDPEAPRVIEGDVVLAWHRAARVVRYTIALRERLAAEARQAATGEGGPTQTHLRVTFVDPKDPEGAAALTARYAADMAAGREVPAAGTTAAAHPAPTQTTPAPASTPAPPAAPAFDPRAAEARKVQLSGIFRRIAEAGFLPGELSPRDTREAGEAIEREAREGVERLSRERLDEADEFAFLRRPISDIVARICRDLGLRPDWSALAQEDWAREEVDSGRVGEPLRPYAPPPPPPHPHAGGDPGILSRPPDAEVDRPHAASP